MRFLTHFFSPDYRHPLARPYDRKRRISLFRRIKSLFSDIAFYFSAFWLGASLIIFVNMVPSVDFNSLFFGSNYKTTQGRVIEEIPSGYSENHKSYYGYRYKYQVNQHDYWGISYHLQIDSFEDSTFTVQYKINDPACSRLAHMRMKPIPIGWFLFISVFVLIGIGLLLLTIKQCSDHLLHKEYGILVPCTLQEATFIKAKNSNASNSYNLIVAFTTLENEQITVTQNVSIKTKLRLQKKLQILYLPWNPKEILI